MSSSALTLNPRQPIATKAEPTVTAPKDQSALQRFVTDKKVQQVFWAALTVLSLVAGATGLALSLVLLPPGALGAIVGIASMVLGGIGFAACMNKSFDFMSFHYNYQDPREIAHARSATLDPCINYSKVIRFHGLENLIKYKILTVDELRIKFQKENAGQDFFYLKAHYDLKKLREYGVMTLDEQRASFEQAIKGKTVLQIMPLCDLDALQKKGVFHPGQRLWQFYFRERNQSPAELLNFIA